MAETILFDFSKFVIFKLSSIIFDEMKSALGVEDELDKIKSNLPSIQAVLRDAEKQQSTSESVANWMGNLRDVMYDIDDLHDEIATEVAIRNKNKGQWLKQVSAFFSRSNFVVLRLIWSHQIKIVCKKLDRVADQRKNFALFSDSVDSSESSLRETHSKVNESDILGRDQDKEAIINSMLCCGDCESLSVLTIVGLGGIGKTTLAKLVYNDKRVNDNFNSKLWVYVSEKFNVKKILRQIISMVTGENLVQLTMEQLTLEQLRIRVSEALKDQKYCLILDDMWNTDSNEWRMLRELLDVGAKGSVVVVTTRDLKVASVVQSVEEYRLSELSKETCLMIFMHLAFKDCENVEPALLELAKKIVKKSRGLPLLVTALGNLLHGKTDETEWNLLLTKLEEGHEDIMNVLKLSYDQLPSYLKLCFRMCSIYGKGTIIHPLDLLPLWMALGFLPCGNQGKSLEYIGWNCIDELSSKSLLQNIKHDPILSDDFSGLLMHDSVYDLAKSMAGDELAIVNCMTKEVSKSIRYIRLDEDFLSGNERAQGLLSKATKARLLMKTSEHPLSKAFLQSTISNL